MKTFFFLMINFLIVSNVMGEKIVVIGNKNIPTVDKKTVSKIYTGKLVMIDNVSVVPVNRSDDKIRDEFLEKYLNMDDEKYIAYWTVRQYIGKGVAPKNINSTGEILEFIKSTQGAIGYITKSEMNKNSTDDLNILLLE
jgi:ABC-type phosphate transport system substrate-binding protein